MVSFFLFIFALALLWSPAHPLCPLPPMVADAAGNTGHDSSNGYYIEYTCIRGYYIGNGDSRLKCSNGTIDGTLPTCMRKRCPSLSPGPRVNISSNKTEYGSVVWVKCERGYKMSSTNSIQFKLTCVDEAQQTGRWSSSMPDCSLITCSNCNVLADGKSNCNSSLTYNYSSTVEYWCNSGYNAHGNNILKCGDKGSWVTDGTGFRMTCNESKTYIGCYNMGIPTPTSTRMNGCRLHCQMKGNHYAGFNNGGCTCMNSLIAQAKNQCEERCQTDGKVTCGGVGNNRTTHFSFYGCYSDSAVPNATMKFPADSTKTCIEYCRLHNARYALLLHSDQCSCTDVVSQTAAPVATSRCQYRNFTDAYFVRIVELEKIYSSCGALYNAGVRYHGLYLLGTNRQSTRCDFKDGTSCDHGWIGFSGACYHFNPDKRTFQESLAYCAARNSDLVSIHDRNEVNFLKRTIKDFQDLKHQLNWFIGLYDNFQLNNYIWSDGTLKVFNDFIIDYPSPNNWQCVYLRANGWADTKCRISGGLICKRKQDSNQCLKIKDTTSGSMLFTQDPQMNPGLCFQMCRGLDMTVSAVNNATCHCYLTMPPHDVLNWTECSHYCYPNMHQRCGGGENISFVTKESGQPEALSCYELQLQEMANPYTKDSAGQSLCTENNTHSCPRTWLASKKSCYKFYESRVHYTDAVKQCIKNNAYVVSINGADEESRLFEMIQKISVFKSIARWWIGLTNVQRMGIFRWSDGQPVTYNKITKIKYDFVVWITGSNKWETHNLRESFICEKDPVFSGCYNDSSSGRTDVIASLDMTVNMCVELCRGIMKTYALLAMYHCFCGDTVTGKTSCSAKDVCKAQPNQLCGKYPVVAVYQVDKYAKFANSCRDLLFEGISTPAMYVVGDKPKTCDFKGNVTICPSDTRPWIGFDGQCYLLMNETKTWVEAQHFCISIGSTLASIRDNGHLEFLTKSIKPRYTLTHQKTVWLGGSDELYEGFYSWVDGNLLSKKQSQTIGTGGQNHLALSKPNYKLTKTKETLGYILCQITKDYRGCFETLSNLQPNITILVTSENLVSVTLCKQLCLGKDFKYSLTNQKSCACVSDLSPLKSVDNKRCRNPCPSENLLSCGSQDTWALHTLDNSELATDCSQLALNGIFLNATYKLWNLGTNSSELKQCGVADNSSCPVGWVGKDGVCYYFSTHETSLTDARKMCFSKSAILAFPINKVARTFIVDMVKSVPTIWRFGRFFVGVQTFNRGSYVVAATGRILKPEVDIPISFNQLILSWTNTYSKPVRSSLEHFICEKFSGYKGCASLSGQHQPVGMTSLAMTATQCLEFCRGQAFSIVAVNVTSCFCLVFDDVLTWETTTNRCIQPCPGFDNQPCGGNNVFSVYEIDPTAPLPESCSELANLGVTAKSTYQLQLENNKAVLKTTCFSTEKEMLSKKMAGRCWCCGVCLYSAENWSCDVGGYAESIQPKNYTFTSKQKYFSTTDLRIHIFPTMTNAWKPTSSNGQWVEVALPSLYVVTGIRTRGVMKPYELWVRSYELFYGDESPGYLAPYNENGITEFQANTDGNSVVTRLFREPFVANTIRLIVKQSHSAIALGFDFLGQPYQSSLDSNGTIGCFADDNSSDFVLATASSKAGCKTKCLSNRYPIYGIQEKKGTFVCKCVLNFGKYGKLNDSECNGESIVSSFILYRTFEIGCPAPKSFQWAKMTPLPIPVGNRYAYKVKAMYTCIPGYEFPDKNNSSIIGCLQNNQWESLPGNCSRKQCQAIPKVRHTITDTNDTHFGSKVTYKCHSRLMFPNYQASVTIECLADGTWNTSVPSCVGLECREPRPLANSNLTSKNRTHATFTCDEGFYFLDGLIEKIFICQQNITWAFNNDECKAPNQFQRQKAVSQGEQNKRIVDPSHSLRARSLLDCIGKCMQHMTCSIISLYTGSSIADANCHLFLGERPLITLADAPGWNMYYMKSL